MTEKSKQILKAYKKEIKRIEDSDLNVYANAEQGLKLSRDYLQKLRILIRQLDFKSKQDEILFFKKQKPYINGRLMFYAKLCQYLLNKPNGTIKRKRKHIDELLEQLHHKRKSNIDFERYYLQNDSRLDKYYFVRGKDKLELISEKSYFFSDPDFTTSHDILVAQIIANELFINHLNSELDYFRRIELQLTVESEDEAISEEVIWSASKTDLVELIYALHSNKSIKDGQISIKNLAMFFEKTFNIDLGNFYRTYLEIRERKMDRTSFLNNMKSSLNRKMEDDDSKY
jgi:hypothetical protein